MLTEVGAPGDGDGAGCSVLPGAPAHGRELLIRLRREYRRRVFNETEPAAMNPIIEAPFMVSESAELVRRGGR